MTIALVIKFQISEQAPAQNLRWRQRSPHSSASQRKISAGLTLVARLDLGANFPLAQNTYVPKVLPISGEGEKYR